VDTQLAAGSKLLPGFEPQPAFIIIIIVVVITVIINRLSQAETAISFLHSLCDDSFVLI